jgi:hypothetical protein
VNLLVSGGVIGVQNTITLDGALALSSNPLCLDCFSIQQNIEIGPPSGGKPYTYWAQNVIVLAQNALLQTEALAGFNLWNNTGGIVECSPNILGVCQGATAGYQNTTLGVSWTLNTEINDNFVRQTLGENPQLVMTNPFGSYTFATPMPTGAFVNVGYTNFGLLTPELILVGPAGGTSATFFSPTSGQVQSSIEMSDGSWSSSVTLVAHQHSDSLSKETSAGLQWTFPGGSTASFGAAGAVQAQGIGFVPSTAVSNATVGGGVSVDQISSTGVSVAITGSTASDGTAVTIATANEGTAQPPGTGQLSLESAGFYDVNVHGISAGTALVCINSSTVSSQTGMQYWSNVGAGSWIVVSTTFTAGTPNSVCGDIPVAALTGTPIAIGPNLPSTPCAADVSTSVTVSRSGYTYNFATRRFYQTLTLTNSSSSTISVPITLVLDSLSSNANLFNGSGVAACGSVTGSRYIFTPALSFAPGASVSVVLQFTNPTSAAITYSTRVLAGPGTF